MAKVHSTPKYVPILTQGGEKKEGEETNPFRWMIEGFSTLLNHTAVTHRSGNFAACGFTWWVRVGFLLTPLLLITNIETCNLCAIFTHWFSTIGLRGMSTWTCYQVDLLLLNDSAYLFSSFNYFLLWECFFSMLCCQKPDSFIFTLSLEAPQDT